MIYVVVVVWYDYHRFQENLAVFEDQSEAILWARGWRTEQGDSRPIYTYKPDGKREETLNEDETSHLWIQEFKLNDGRESDGK